MSTILVLGTGNSLLTDDGAGVHAALLLRDAVGDEDGLVILDAGTLSFSLFPYIETADALVAFDAAHFGGQPGDVIVQEDEAFDRFVLRSGRSVHEIGLADLLDMARLAGRLPAHRVLIGIEPAGLGWGLDLSPAVAAAMPRCVEIARRYIDDWRATLAAAPANAPAPAYGEPAHAV